MAKFYGAIGFAVTTETTPGVWTEEVVERMYRGDILTFRHRIENGEGVNDNLNISNEISIVADSFVSNNFSHMIYIQFMGARWKITGATIEYPRIILQIGGVYNANTPDVTPSIDGSDRGE